MTHIPQRLRGRCYLGVLAPAAGVLSEHVPMIMIALLMVMLTRPLQRQLRSAPRKLQLQLDPPEWHQVWMSQRAVCVIARSRFWVFRDECAPEEWARLRRTLRLHTPRSPLGLSISR